MAARGHAKALDPPGIQEAGSERPPHAGHSGSIPAGNRPQGINQ